MIRRSFVVTMTHGLQGRPAALLVQTVQRFPGTDVTLSAAGRTVNARILSEVLSVGIRAGTSVLVICNGPQEDQVMAALGRILETGFDET